MSTVPPTDDDRSSSGGMGMASGFGIDLMPDPPEFGASLHAASIDLLPDDADEIVSAAAPEPAAPEPAASDDPDGPGEPDADGPPADGDEPNALASGGDGKDLTGRTVQGFAWMLLGSGSQQVLQVLVVAILGRLLLPEQFGVVAAALIVVNMLDIISDAGIGPALIQRPSLSDAHIRVGFTATFIFAVALWGLIAASATPIANLLSVPEAAEILPALSLVFVLRSATVGEYLLSRRMEFKTLALVEITSYVIGYGVIAVTLALRGAGVWALVFGQLGQSTIRLINLWIVAPHPMKPSLDRRALKDLLGYGGGHVLAKGGHFAATQADNIIVANVLGPASLGLYTRAYQFLTSPAILFGKVVDRVLFPAMSSVQDDRRRLASAYFRGLELVALLVLPLSLSLAVVGREVILLLLGDQWLDALPAFTVLVTGMLFRTSYRLSDSLSRATGAVYRRAWRTFMFAALVSVGAWFGSRWGLVGVSAGVLFALFGNFILMAGLSLRLLDARWTNFAGAHLGGIIVGVCAAIGTAAFALPLRAAAFPVIIILLAGGMGAASAIVLVSRISARHNGVVASGWRSALQLLRPPRRIRRPLARALGLRAAAEASA